MIITKASMGQEDIFSDVYASTLGFKNMEGMGWGGREQLQGKTDASTIIVGNFQFSQDRKSKWVFQPI